MFPNKPSNFCFIAPSDFLQWQVKKGDRNKIPQNFISGSVFRDERMWHVTRMKIKTAQMFFEGNRD